MEKMDSQQLEAKVIEVISKKLNIDAANVSSSSRFQEDLGADSLDIVELLMEIEEEFGVSIPDEESEKLKTVGDACNFIASKAG